MLNAHHAFCERLYFCDFNRESMQSREVVQTFNLGPSILGPRFNRTSLSDRAAYRMRDFRNPMEIQGRAQKTSCSCAPQMPSVTRKKIIVLCYLNGQ